MAEFSVQAILSALDKGFTSTLKDALGTTDKLSSKLTSGFNFGILTGMGQQAFSMLTSGVSGLISEIDSSNAAWKTFEANMSIVEKSGGKLEKSIGEVKASLQDYATQTVYSASDMASTYAQLAAVGTKNTEKLVKGFGGLAAASENPQQAMKTLSQQATQMAAKPSVAWQDFKLMLEQTPAGIAAVAKHMGMSTAELVTAVQDGEVATDKFFNAIAEVGGDAQGEFYKMATEAKTVGQAMDGLKETVGNKLTPAFDVLSQVGIKAINGLADSFAGIDAQALATKVSLAVETVGEFLNVLKTSFAGSRKAVGDALSAIGSALGATNGEFSKTDALNTFKTACEGVAGVITKVANFLEDNAETIAKVTPYIAGLAGAFIGLKVVNTVAPGLTRFATVLLSLAGKGIVGLAAKLFGVSLGQKAVGTASATSSPSIWQSALACLALGAAVLLAAAGLALLVQSAIALASAGWPAVGALVALLGVIVGLAAGAAFIGPALTASAAGLLAFGAAIALIGVGAILAAAGLAIIANVLPLLVAYGLKGSVAILALGGALAVFSVGAAAAGAATAVLGAGLLVVASALLVAGAAMVLFSVGALLTAASLSLLSLVMPTLATYGSLCAVAITELGVALVAFGAGALVATVPLVAFGAAMLVSAAGTVVFAAALVGVSSSMKTIASNAKNAEKSLDGMQSSVDAVESGLNALGSKVKSAMSKLTSAFDKTANKAKSAGNKVGTGFTEGMKGGLAAAVPVAATTAVAVNTTLLAGRAGAFNAGANISQGFAQGMRSQLSVIRSAAAQMAEAADKAVKAKAKIHSPSKVSAGLGSYWGEGFVNGIANMAKDAWAAAEELVSIPTVATPRLAMAYGGELSTDYNYSNSSEYTIEVPLTVDGKEFARATATYTQNELSKRENRESRKHGRV